MTHVASHPEITPFRPHFRAFYLHRADESALRAEGSTHFPAPRETWFAPFDSATPHAPSPPRPTLHAPTPHDVGASGFRLGADRLPLATAGAPTVVLPKSEPGLISTSGLSISVCHRTGRFLRKNPSAPPGRGHRASWVSLRQVTVAAKIGVH